MPMYNKIFTKILDSSIWLEPDATRLVWLTLIAAMDEDGMCQFASVANLAHRARVTMEAAKEAVTALEGPDDNSSDPDNEGRRIERVPGGWIVLNAKKYRELVTRTVIKEQTRARVARHRAKRIGNEEKRTCNDDVTPSEADTHTPTKEEKKQKAGYAVPACFESVSGFSLALAGWIESRKTLRKPATARAIQILIDRLSERPKDAVAALDMATERGWMTVKWDWFDNERKSSCASQEPELPDLTTHWPPDNTEEVFNILRRRVGAPEYHPEK